MSNKWNSGNESHATPEIDIVCMKRNSQYIKRKKANQKIAYMGLPWWCSG